MITITGTNRIHLWTSAEIQVMLRGEKRKENRDRDVQTQTERYEDYKCLCSSVNLHNQRQACPVNSNRHSVFTSVGAKTTSNLQERDAEREKEDGKKGRRAFQRAAGLLGVS